MISNFLKLGNIKSIYCLNMTRETYLPSLIYLCKSFKNIYCGVFIIIQNLIDALVNVHWTIANLSNHNCHKVHLPNNN